MATVVPVYAAVEGNDDVKSFTYTLTTANADGAGIPFVQWADVTVTATGTWGGATLKMQGSADGSTYVATGLSNAAGGTEFTATGDKIAALVERPRYIRPILTTAGSGATVTVTVVLRRSRTNR